MKIIISIAIFIFVVVGGFLLINSNQEKVKTEDGVSLPVAKDTVQEVETEEVVAVKEASPDTKVVSKGINSIYGFSFTPPEGWVLWEGVTSARDSMGEDLPAGTGDFKITDPVTMQKYMTSWSPRNSHELIFTNSKVDVKSRDLNIASDYIKKLENEPSPYNFVMLRVVESPVNYGQAELENDFMEIKFIEFLGTKASMLRVKDATNSDGGTASVLLGLPLSENRRLNILTTATKDNPNPVVFLEQFMIGLEIF